jgi:hypothetical protein
MNSVTLRERCIGSCEPVAAARSLGAVVLTAWRFRRASVELPRCDTLHAGQLATRALGRLDVARRLLGLLAGRDGDRLQASRARGRRPCCATACGVSAARSASCGSSSLRSTSSCWLARERVDVAVGDRLDPAMSTLPDSTSLIALTGR